MTNNTQFKTLLNTWLNQKKPMITPSTHASFTLIAENHLIPHYYNVFTVEGTAASRVFFRIVA